jgi:hypothetical protein
MTDTAPAAEYCEKHPTRATRLRCNNCNRLMCAQCAVRTPTGYRCTECVKGQQRIFNTAKIQDYIFGPLTAAGLGFIGGLIIPNLWIYFIIIAAPFAGAVIAEAALRVIGKRRAKRLFQVIAAAAFLGGVLPSTWPLLLLFIPQIATVSEALGAFGANFLWNALYAGITAGAVYYRLAGIRLNF